MKRIYLDYNATTPLHPEVLSAMLPYLQESYGNASSIHHHGQTAKRAIEEAREQVAHLIHASPGEVVFTGGGTEADNLAIKGVAFWHKAKAQHIITSSIEHAAVLRTCQFLEAEGFPVTFLPVDRYGMIDADDLRKAVREETLLISVMHSNNEVGTIQPIDKFSEIARAHQVLLHTDAIQSAGKVPVDVGALGVDLLTLSAHKICGPKGVGALYIKNGTGVRPFLHGGHQEMNRRAGTENVPGIVGFGKAAELASVRLAESQAGMESLRDYFWEKIQQRVDHIQLNGHPSQRLPNTLNVAFEFIEGESAVINLDLHGVAASSGSACTSGSLEPSHVLTAMGLSKQMAQGSLRFSLGKQTTREEIDQAAEVVTEVVHRLRSMSPFYKDAKQRKFEVRSAN